MKSLYYAALAIVLILASGDIAYAQEQCPACAHPDVIQEYSWAWEEDGYIREYGDENAWVWGNGLLAKWAIERDAAWCAMESACVELADGTTYWPQPLAWRFWSPTEISRVVLCVRCEEPPMAEPTPTPQPEEQYVAEPMSAILLLTGLTGLWAFAKHARN